MERVAELEPIKDEKEYAEVDARLRQMTEEYVLISQNPERALEEAKNEYARLIEEFSNAQSKDEQKEKLREIYYSKVKCLRLNDDTYLPALRQNMMKGYVRTRAYDGELNLTEINRYGIVPNEVNLGVEPIDDIMEQVAKLGNLVNPLEGVANKEHLPVPVDKDYPAYSPASDLAQKVYGKLDAYIHAVEKNMPESVEESREPREEVMDARNNIPGHYNERLDRSGNDDGNTIGSGERE